MFDPPLETIHRRPWNSDLRTVARRSGQINFKHPHVNRLTFITIFI